MPYFSHYYNLDNRPQYMKQTSSNYSDNPFEKIVAAADFLDLRVSSCNRVAEPKEIAASGDIQSLET